MQSIGVREARMHPPRLPGRVAEGNGLAASHDDRPSARLAPVENEARKRAGRIVDRRIGLDRASVSGLIGTVHVGHRSRDRSS